MRFYNVWEKIPEDGSITCNIFIGGKRIGKTYSCLSGLLDGHIPGKLLYSMLTDKQTSMAASEAGNIFKSINRDQNTNLYLFPEKGHYVIQNSALTDDGRRIPEGDILGYAACVTDCAGFNMSDVTHYMVDEFIQPGSKRKPFKDKFGAIMRAYDTINDNREFRGEKPLCMILIANADNIYDDFLIGADLVSTAERMILDGKEDHYDLDRRIGLHIIHMGGEYMEERRRSAVSDMTKGTAFGGMAIDNKFGYNDFTCVERKSLRGAKPVANLYDKAFIYYLSGEDAYYVSYVKAFAPWYGHNEAGKRCFAAEIAPLILPYQIRGKMYYQSYEVKCILADFTFL